MDERHAVGGMMEMKTCTTKGCTSWMMKPANQTFTCSRCTDTESNKVIPITYAGDTKRRETVAFLVDLLLHVQDQGIIVGRSDCGQYYVHLVP